MCSCVSYVCGSLKPLFCRNSSSPRSWLPEECDTHFLSLFSAVPPPSKNNCSHFKCKIVLDMLFLGRHIMAQMSVIWRAQTLVKHVAWFIWILFSYKFCFWKGNSYKCIFNKVRYKNNCLAFSALFVFSKTQQYYFNAKRWFAQAVSETDPLSLIWSDWHSCFSPNRYLIF